MKRIIIAVSLTFNILFYTNNMILIMNYKLIVNSFIKMCSRYIRSGEEIQKIRFLNYLDF